MNIQQAIDLATEQGYPVERIHVCKDETGEWDSIYEPTLLDPIFWQSLGKVMGWEKKAVNPLWPVGSGWELMWHLFIHHLAEHRDANSFFETL